MSRLLAFRRSKEDAPPEGSTFLEDEPSSDDEESSASCRDDEVGGKRSEFHAASPSPYQQRSRLPSSPTATCNESPVRGVNHSVSSERITPSAIINSRQEELVPVAAPPPPAPPTRTSFAQRIANFGKGHNNNNNSKSAAAAPIMINEAPSAAADAAVRSPTGVKELVATAAAAEASPSPVQHKALIRERIARHLLQRRANHPTTVDRGVADNGKKKVSIGHASNTATSTQDDDLMNEDDDDQEEIGVAIESDEDPARSRKSSSSLSPRKKSSTGGGGRGPNKAPSSSLPSRRRADNDDEEADRAAAAGTPSTQQQLKQRPSLVKGLAPPSMADVMSSIDGHESDDGDAETLNRSHSSGSMDGTPLASPRRGRKKPTVVVNDADEGGPIRASAMDRYFAKVHDLRSRSRSRSRSLSREPSTRTSGARSVVVMGVTGGGGSNGGTGKSSSSVAPPARSVSGSALPSSTMMRRRGSGGGASVATVGVARNHSLNSSLSQRRRLHSYYNNDNDDTRSVLPEMLRPSSSAAFSSSRSVATDAPLPPPSPSSSRRNRSHTPSRLLSKSPRRTTSGSKDREGLSGAAAPPPPLLPVVRDVKANTPIMELPSRRSELEYALESSPLAVRKEDVEAAPSFCRRASHTSTATASGAASIVSEAAAPSASAVLSTPGRPRRAVAGSSTTSRPPPSRPSPVAAPKTPDPSPKAKLSGSRAVEGTPVATTGGTATTPSRHSAAGDRDMEEMYGPRKASRRSGRPSSGDATGSHPDIDPTTPDYQRPVLFQSPAPKTPSSEETLNMSGSRMLQRSNSTDSSSPGSAVSDPSVERILKMLDDISPSKKSTTAQSPATPDTPTSIEGCQTPVSSRSVRRSRRIKISANLLSDDEDNTIVSQDLLDANVSAVTPSHRIDRLKKEMLDEVLAARGKSSSPKARRIIVKPVASPDPAASPRNGHEVMKDYASKAASLLAKELASPRKSSSALERAKSQRKVEENSIVLTTPVRKAKSSRNVTKDLPAADPARDADTYESDSQPVVAGKSSQSPKTPSRSSHDRSSRSNHERKAKSPRTPASQDVDRASPAKSDVSPSRSPKGSKNSPSKHHAIPARTSSSESKRSESDSRKTKSPAVASSRSSAANADSVHEKRPAPSRNASGQSAASKDSVNRSLHKSRSMRKTRSDGGGRHEAEAKLEASSSSLSRKSTSHRSVARSTKTRHDEDPISVNPVEGRKAMKMLRYQSESSLVSNDMSESSPKTGSFAQLQIPGIDCHQTTMGVQFEDC